MKDTLITDENKPKFSFKKILFPIIFILLIFLAVYGIFTFINNKKIEEEKKKEEIKLENPLNDELHDIKHFAIKDNYIVGINSDLSYVNIYNLMQGTGQFGDFKNYFYYDKNLYLIFSDNNIYKISLTSGNKVYELTKYLNLESSPSFINFISKNNIIVLERNNLELIKRQKKDSKTVLATYENIGGILYSNRKVYIISNSSLYAYDLESNTNNKIADNVSSIRLFGNILVYKSEDKFYGYNTKTLVNSELVSGVFDTIISNNKIYALTGDAIYNVSDKNKKIYDVHYNNLDNFNAIGKYIEVYDTDTVDVTKKRVIFIDTSDYKNSVSDNLYTNIKEYTYNGKTTKSNK